MSTEIEAAKEQSIVQKLAESFPESERAEMGRHIWLAMANKTYAVKGKDDNGKNVTEQVKFNAPQALAYVMACKELGLNPVMSHVIMLEGQFYITLQGHLQNAHASGSLLGMETTLLGWAPTKFTFQKKWWGDKPATSKTCNQYRYKCTITKRVGDQTATFSAEGVADESNVAGGDYASEIKIEQMAEARAMRRCLSRAFPVGMGNFEDVQEQTTIERSNHEVETRVAEATADELMNRIEGAKTQKELEATKTDVKASKDNKYVAAYAQKLGRLNNAEVAQPAPEPVTTAEDVGSDTDKSEQA